MSDALLLTIGTPVNENIDIFLLYFLPPLIMTIAFSLILIGFGAIALWPSIFVFLAVSLLCNFAVIATYKKYDIVK